MQHNNNNGLQQSTFVIESAILKDMFSSDPNIREDCDKLVAYVAFYNKKLFVTHSVYQKIENQLQGESVLNYINAVISDGGEITGAAGFPTENEDILFLIGNLTLSGYKEIKVIRKGTDIEADKKTLEKSNVLKELQKLGLMKFGFQTTKIADLMAAIRVTDNEFNDYVSNQYL